MVRLRKQTSHPPSQWSFSVSLVAPACRGSQRCHSPRVGEAGMLPLGDDSRALIRHCTWVPFQNLLHSKWNNNLIFRIKKRKLFLTKTCKDRQKERTKTKYISTKNSTHYPSMHFKRDLQSRKQKTARWFPREIPFGDLSVFFWKFDARIFKNNFRICCIRSGTII